MGTILNRFSSRRMLNDYWDTAYTPAAQQNRLFGQNDNAAVLAAWKQRIRESWNGVAIHMADRPAGEVFFGEMVEIKVQLTLNGLLPQDLVVDCLFGQGWGDTFTAEQCIRLQLDESVAQSPDSAFFSLNWPPEFCGLKRFRVRVYPWHKHLSHPFEMGCMRWLSV